MRTPGPDVAALALSGGNQQKLIVGREMMAEPVVLIAAQPTRGVDVGAQAAIWDDLREARAANLAMLLLSADLEELIGLSDTLYVIYRGQLVAKVDPRTVTPADLGSYMTGAARSRARREAPRRPALVGRPRHRRRLRPADLVHRPGAQRPQRDRRLPGHVGLRHHRRFDRGDHQPGRPLLHRGLRRGHRLQDEPVQHRRRRPVPPRRADGRRRRRRRPPACLHGDQPAPRGGDDHGGGLRQHRRDLEGHPGCQRGRLDDHVELHRHRLERLPARQLLPQPLGESASRDRPAAPLGLAPLAQRALVQDRDRPAQGHHVAEHGAVRRRDRGAVLRRHLAHPLRFRPADIGRQPRTRRERLASTRRP